MKPGPNRVPGDTTEKIEQLAHILENKYGFDTAFAAKTLDNDTGKVIFYGIGVDLTTQGEMDRFIQALKKENPKIQNVQIGEQKTQVKGKIVYFVTWDESLP